MAASFPLVASKDAHQAGEPPTSEASEDILHPGNLRAIARGGPGKKTNIGDSSCRAKCVQEQTIGGGPQAEKGGTSDPPKSEDG